MKYWGARRPATSSPASNWNKAPRNPASRHLVVAGHSSREGERRIDVRAGKIPREQVTIPGANPDISPAPIGPGAPVTESTTTGPAAKIIGQNVPMNSQRFFREDHRSSRSPSRFLPALTHAESLTASRPFSRILCGQVPAPPCRNGHALRLARHRRSRIQVHGERMREDDPSIGVPESF